MVHIKGHFAWRLFTLVHPVLCADVVTYKGTSEEWRPSSAEKSIRGLVHRAPAVRGKEIHDLYKIGQQWRSHGYTL